MEDTVDRLTGLCDRDHFARAVDQADRDRDRMVVAMLAIDGLAEVNQLCGYDAGDALLAELGRALAPHRSVDATVGRIGGGLLALLLAPAGDRQPGPTTAPLIDDLTAAIERWRGDLAGLGTPSPITPVVRAGAAAGYGAGTWSDAEAALALAADHPDGEGLVTFDLSHPHLDGLRRRQGLVEDLAAALDRDQLPIDRYRVEPLPPAGRADGGRAADDGGDGSGWIGLQARTGPARGRRRPGTGLAADDVDLAPGLAGQIDRHLLLAAVTQQEGGRARRRDDRVSVSLLGPLGGPRSAIDRIPAAVADRGLIIEVDQTRLLADRHRSGRGPADTRRSNLGRRLEAAGLQLGVTGFDGGWEIVDLLDGLPVHHVTPDHGLIRSALAGGPAGAILSTAVGIATDRRWAVVGPAESAEWAADADRTNLDDPVRVLGLTHRRRDEP